MPNLLQQLGRLCGVATLVLLTACSDSSDRPPAPVPEPIPEPQAEVMPIVFVHGQSGSAQQFESQAMRFTSNEYPQDQLFAFEYDTSLEDNPIAALDTFVDEVLAETGAEQVYAIGHSRGTSVWTTYLDDPEFNAPDKVAKYVNIDGRAPENLPGGVPTIGIWGEWNTADSGFNRTEDNVDSQIGPNAEDNFYFPEKSHTEVATSADAFGLMYEFLSGIAAATTDIQEMTGTVEVAGRTVLFPENLGYADHVLELWELDNDSGARSGSAPVATFNLDESGSFGPVEVEAGQRYEFALLREPTESIPVASVHHFYPEPFIHHNHFVRLQSSIPGSSIEAFIPRLEDSSGLVAVRQKEFWGNQGAQSDELFVNGVNVLQPGISPRELTGGGAGVNLAVFIFDDEGDNVTDFEKGELFPFNALTFLTGVDVFIPAEETGRGTVEITLVDRGESEVQLNVPNWPSANNRVSVMFRDDR